MSEETIGNLDEFYARGKENIRAAGKHWSPPGGGYGPAATANRKILQSMFIETRYLDPPEANANFTLFGHKFKTPIFCSAISRAEYMNEKSLSEIAKGIAAAGSFIMHGIGGHAEMQAMVSAGAPVIKIIKPYRNSDLIHETLREAESAGCFAVGMDIDHFYGRFRVNGQVQLTDTFAPQKTEFIKKLITDTKLPFIIKGVLSLTDAEKAVQLGASAIVVSNHGSGSFQFGIPSLYALPKIVESYGNKITILVDTGFETGIDALKGLAMGAKGVGFASAVTLAWAADGSNGVEKLINQLTWELKRTMAIAGCANLTCINKSIVVHLPQFV